MAAPAALFLPLGVGLTGFAAQLALRAVRPRLAVKIALEVVLADLARVVVTSLALAIYRAHVPSTGARINVSGTVVVTVVAGFRCVGPVRARRAAALIPT